MSRSAKQRRKAAKARKRLKAAVRGEASVTRGRNYTVLGMILTRKGGVMRGESGDARKERSRKACRGKAKEE